MLIYNTLSARYRTLEECYRKPSYAKINACTFCKRQAEYLEDVFRPEFSVKSVSGITGFNCMQFTYTTDIYVELPVYTGQNETGSAYVLVCERVDTKDHTRFSFSHAVYRLPDTVLLRLFDLCPHDISYYYSYAQQQAMRRKAGVLD